MTCVLIHILEYFQDSIICFAHSIHGVMGGCFFLFLLVGFLRHLGGLHYFSKSSTSGCWFWYPQLEAPNAYSQFVYISYYVLLDPGSHVSRLFSPPSPLRYVYVHCIFLARRIQHFLSPWTRVEVCLYSRHSGNKKTPGGHQASDNKEAKLM